MSHIEELRLIHADINIVRLADGYSLERVTPIVI